MSLSVSSPSEWWRPRVGLTWQWQLSEPPVDNSIEADVYDIEVFDNDASLVADLHAKERRVIGYINVGSSEDWRPDRDRFPPEVLGKDYEGWPGEKWLDIRRLDLLAPIKCARMDLCQAKGFDAVEPDNMDIHGVDSGFPITYDDQLKYVLWLADESHQRGFAIGIKNAAEQVPAWSIISISPSSRTISSRVLKRKCYHSSRQASRYSRQSMMILKSILPRLAGSPESLASASSKNIAS